MKLKIQRISDVNLPSYVHKGDSGLDLYSAEDCVLKPRERKLISTGIKIAVPNGYEAQIRPKSGLAIKHGLSILNTPGTIDSGYRGEVKIIAINLGQEPIEIEKNTKIAQMVINKIEHADIEEVKELSQTSRGEGGFGSTGERENLNKSFEMQSISNELRNSQRVSSFPKIALRFFRMLRNQKISDISGVHKDKLYEQK